MVDGRYIVPRTRTTSQGKREDSIYIVQTTDSTTDSPEYHFGLDLSWPDMTRRQPKIVVRNSGKKQEEVYVASPLSTLATPFLPGI